MRLLMRPTFDAHWIGIRAAGTPACDQDRPRSCPVMDPYLDTVKQWLAEDASAPRKQRHTAKRVFDRLVDEYAFSGREVTNRPYHAALLIISPPLRSLP